MAPRRRLPARVVNLAGRPWKDVASQLHELLERILDWMNDSWGGVHNASNTPNTFIISSGEGTLEDASGVLASSCGPGAITLTQGTITDNCPYINHTATWNDAGENFTGFKSNITSTASGDDSKLMDLQVAGVSRFYIGKEVALDNATHFMQVQGTLPSSPSAFVSGVRFDVTTAGSTAQAQAAVELNLLPGFTGNQGSFGIYLLSQVASPLANWGIDSVVTGTTTGNNFGLDGNAGNGDQNYGVRGLANYNKNGAKNIGVLGGAVNTGTTPVIIGGIFALTDDPGITTSAALIADNAATTNPIARFRDNGTDQVKIGDGVPNDNSQHFLEVVGTLPSSPSASPRGIVFDVTSAGSSATFAQYAFSSELQAGYTGSSFSYAAYLANFAAGTGTNSGVHAEAQSTTTGTNIGVSGNATGGNSSYGVLATAITAKNSATNVGSIGLGRNTGTTPVEVGGFFGLNTTVPSLESAALVADNAAVSAPIFVARDNGTTVWSVQDAGHVYAKMATKTLTEATATAFVRIAVAQSTSVAGKVKYQIQANDATDFQSRSGELHFTAVNKAGTETVTLSTPGAETEVFAESAGGSTLTNTFDTVTGTDTFDIRANATSSLTQTTLRINYTLDLWSHSVTTVTPL